MSRRASIAAPAVALLLMLSAAPLAAQEGAHAPASRRTTAAPSAAAWAWGGAGAAVPQDRPGADRRAGPTGMLALERSLLARVTARLEVSGNVQQFDAGPDALIDGDLQQALLLVAARYAPRAFGVATPYALAGIGMSWQSERVILRDASNPVPDAEFQQTTSRTARGVLLGVGVATTGTRMRLFGEARWIRTAGPDGPTTDVGLVAGLAAPLRFVP